MKQSTLKILACWTGVVANKNFEKIKTEFKMLVIDVELKVISFHTYLMNSKL